MHYNIQLNTGDQTCYLVVKHDNYSITATPRNATTFDTYAGAAEIHRCILALSPKEVKCLLRRESTFEKPVQVNVKSWRDSDVKPMTVRSKLYTFSTPE